MTRPDCRCGHTAAAHQHYRPGTDCGRCWAPPCHAYRPPHPIGRLLKRLGRR